MSDDAWRLFRRLIGDAGAEWRLVQAWRDVRAVEAKFGWDWPSYETILRRWHALPAARRVALRHGTDAAVKALRSRCCATRRASRPSNGSSLGGRTLDFRVDWGDGRGVRPVMLALADVASNVVLGWELTDGEDAAATVRLICRVCRSAGSAGSAASTASSTGSTRTTAAPSRGTRWRAAASDAELREALAALDGDGLGPAPQPARKVVAGRFGGPGCTRPAPEPDGPPSKAELDRHRADMDRALGLCWSGGGAA